MMTDREKVEKELDCRFCKSLEFRKEMNARRTAIEKQLFKEKYTVALVNRTLGPYGKSGRTTDYGFRGCGYPLKYCPMCGKKIARKVGEVNGHQRD